MSLFLANPWGLLVLAGLPAILAIHLLRRKSRQVVVSTLFLIERALPSSEGGRRIRVLRNSFPLWVQLLAVAALAWLAAQPRWIDRTSTQTVVAVFDESASMSAFRREALARARAELRRLAGAASQTQWIVIGSDRSRLAAGSDLEAVLAEAGKTWRPALGVHDPSEALRLARMLAGEQGCVIFLTDRPPARGTSAAASNWIAVGRPIENVGFIGARAEADHWSALIKNCSPAAREVRWRAGEKAPWQSAQLGPGATTEISGAWPEKTDRLTLELENDPFALDNRLPLIRPREKSLGLFVAPGEDFAKLFEQIARLATPAQPASPAEADAALGTYDPKVPQAPPGNAILFLADADPSAKPLTGPIVAENDPLMEGLSWQGLMARESDPMPPQPGDAALLWQEARPLIFLRTTEAGLQLCLNFDVRQSNAAHLPAFALLLHRFFDRLRESKEAYSAANVDTGQLVPVAGAGKVRAPDQPGFFEVKDPQGRLLFEGTAQFADPRQSDFQAAASGGGVEAVAHQSRLANARGAVLDPLWLFLASALMLWNWSLTGAPVRERRVA